MAAKPAEEPIRTTNLALFTRQVDALDEWCAERGVSRSQAMRWIFDHGFVIITQHPPITPPRPILPEPNPL